MGLLKKINDVLKQKAPASSSRSPKWSRVRAAHLKDNPTCAVCGTKHKIEVHHILPFHLFPEQELNPANLITLCENSDYGIICHLLVGHLGDYKNLNRNVREDAVYWKGRLDAK